jgi:3-keto-5-aminohexanoate cleavage enzyme
MAAEIPSSWPYAGTDEFMDRVQNGMPPLMVCIECNGGVQGKEANDALPETSDEIADSVYGAYREGATPAQARRMLGISATPTRY